MNIAKIASIQDPEKRKLIMKLLQEFNKDTANKALVDRLIKKITEKE